MSGIVGRLFREFSLTVSVALVVSAIVSLTVTPMMCRVLLPLDRARHSSAAQMSASAFAHLAATYDRALTMVLRHPAVTLAITLLVLAATLVMFWTVSKGFFPQQDTGQILGASEAPTDISAPAMAARQLELVKIVSADPDVANVYSWISPTPAMSNGRLVINLKPFDQRSAEAGQIMARLRQKVAGVPGIELHLRTRQELQIGGRSSQTQFQYSLEDTDVRQLYAWTPRLIDALKTLPQLSDVTSDVQAAAPRTTVVIDRDRAAQFGITPQAVDDTLYDALGQRQVATIFTQVDQYHVVMELDPAHRLDADALQQIRVASASGQQVPLAAIAHFDDSIAPLQINHQGQFPAVTLSFNLATGVALGDAVAAVSQRLEKMTLPPTMHGSFQGNAKAFQASEGTQPYLILAAILAVYIVLGILYESYIHPLTIISTLPSAGLGALLALELLHYELNVISMIGIILLIGIVKKNAIMMIDVAIRLERDEAREGKEAIYEAAMVRLRPIMMTTAAAVLGAVPLAIGLGQGSSLRQPLGITVMGGLLLSQVFTLYTTPVIYLSLDRLRLRLISLADGLRGRPAGSAQPGD
jgi:multidrug efflux pump